jgi:hypothetical protein
MSPPHLKLDLDDGGNVVSESPASNSVGIFGLLFKEFSKIDSYLFLKH